MKTKPTSTGGQFNSLWFAALLAGILALMFWESFLPGVVHFSNDGPLGVQNADVLDLPQGMTGVWFDLNSIGFASGAFTANVTTLLKWLLGPVGYSKFLPPIALFILGMGAWTLFRQLRFSPVACALGGIAAALSSAFFSTACWGVASQQVAIGMNFIAVALVIASSRAPSLARQIILLVLAGAAVGLSIMEGLDNGALFSICIAAFTVFLSVFGKPGPWWKGLLAGVARTAIIAICSAIVAAQTLSALITTQIQGVAGTGQDERTKEQQWDWATHWSLPKKEALSFIVPGLFGFRMDTPDGGNYWGGVGRDPAWDRYFASGQSGPPPAAMMRFSGGAAYLGVPVALIAIWAAWQAFRRKDSAFAIEDRRILWFWIATAAIAMLLAFGRFAPFYKLFYAAPYFSTIRNPVKFTAIFNFAALVLFAYGVNALWRRYVIPARPAAAPAADGSDKRWILGMYIAIGVSVIAWILYASAQQNFLAYLERVQAQPAEQIAKFSMKQVGWFIVFLIASVVVMTMILKGKFSGARAKTAGIVLGGLIVIDLGLANLPWTVFVDYEQKYASNPVIDFLREKPHENRAAIAPAWAPMFVQGEDQQRMQEVYEYLKNLYAIEWHQHHFPYFNIQSLDVVQMPRKPNDLLLYDAAFAPSSVETLPLQMRHWELANVRYLLAPADFALIFNHVLDPERKRFRVAQRFTIAAKQGVMSVRKLEELTAYPQTNGMWGLIEFTGALPRAKLYSNWRVSTNSPAAEKWAAELAARLKMSNLGLNDIDRATLHELTTPEFNPNETVLLAAPLQSAATNSAGTNAAGSVEYVSYSPKNIRLKAEAQTASVLLLNDKHDPNWKVFVDGKEAELLRCNFIMRGVFLPPGTHDVQFVFRTDLRPLYVTIAAMTVCLLLAGYVVVSGRKSGAAE